MAVKEITPIKMALNTLTDTVPFAAATTAADGFAITFTQQDTKTVLLVQGGAAAGTLTVKQGDSIQGVADTEAFAVKAGATQAIVLESGKFKNVTGVNKGKVIAIPSTTDIKLAAIVLP